jgi:hypothetical protein
VDARLTHGLRIKGSPHPIYSEMCFLVHAK